MDYETACEATVSAKRARAEIDRHDVAASKDEAWAEFVAEHGDRPTYLGKTVLDWLGY